MINSLEGVTVTHIVAGGTLRLTDEEFTEYCKTAHLPELTKRLAMDIIREKAAERAAKAAKQ